MTCCGIGYGKPGYRVGVAWVPGSRWWFGRLALFAGLGNGRAITIGIGEQEDPSEACRVWALGPLSVALHELEVKA